MRILYILKHNPWGIGGGCYACRNYLEVFSEIFKECRVDVLVCEEYLAGRNDNGFCNCSFIPVGKRTTIEKCLSPLTGILHRHQAMAKRLIMENDYAYCVFDHNSIAGTLVDVCRKREIKTIVLNHNCEQEYFRDNNGWIKRALLMSVVRKNEWKSYVGCTYNIFLTEEDRELFRCLYGDSCTHCIVGGCFLRKDEDLNKYDVASFNKDNPKIVISGTMGNVQNLDGINYFLDNLYELIPRNMEIVMAGRNPSEDLKKRIDGYENITLVPNPDDILDIVRRCDIFVCPTRLGGGMKLRVIDGLRCGLPVIAHNVSARGYSFFESGGMLKRYETPKEFGRCLNDVIGGIERGVMDKSKIMAEARNIFSFKAAVSRMNVITKR